MPIVETIETRASTKDSTFLSFLDHCYTSDPLALSNPQAEQIGPASGLNSCPGDPGPGGSSDLDSVPVWWASQHWVSPTPPAGAVNPRIVGARIEGSITPGISYPDVASTSVGGTSGTFSGGGTTSIEIEWDDPIPPANSTLLRFSVDLSSVSGTTSEIGYFEPYDVDTGDPITDDLFFIATTNFYGLGTRTSNRVPFIVDAGGFVLDWSNHPFNGQYSPDKVGIRIVVTDPDAYFSYYPSWTYYSATETIPDRIGDINISLSPAAFTEYDYPSPGQVYGPSIDDNAFIQDYGDGLVPGASATAAGHRHADGDYVFSVGLTLDTPLVASNARLNIHYTNGQNTFFSLWKAPFCGAFTEIVWVWEVDEIIDLDFPAGNAGYGKYMRVIGSDVEFNANQVASYVQNMLGFTVSPGYLCPALGTTWTTPEGDEAWWYDANRPESGEFLGAIITKIVGLNSTMSRKPMTHGSGIGGSILGPLRSSARAIGFETVIYATTCRGMEYGKRVIIDGLRGRGCRSNCELDEIEIWTCCPGENELGDLDPEPRWRIKRVGLSEGPVEGDPPMPTRQCNVRSLKWIMTSESPWLYKETETQITGAHFTLNGDPVSTEACWDVCDWIWDELEVTCVLMSAEGIGETASIIYISSGDSKFTGTITVRDVENTDEDDPLLRYEVYELPANKTLIIDSSSHQILTLDNVTGLVTPDGGRYLYTTGGGIPFKFITVNSACSDRQICITTTPGNMDTTASVRIDLVHREL